jgi:hypothetical protein
MARRVKSLRTIGWSSLFSFAGEDWETKGESECDVEEDFEWQMSTKVWITRADGRIRVRRMPT